MISGKEGEEYASKFLRKNGYKIIERNYRTPFGEVDIIARDKDTLVFIEVKTRASDEFGLPIESLTSHKKSKIAKVALSYVKRLKSLPPCRFDVVSITIRNGRAEASIVRDAFEITYR